MENLNKLRDEAYRIAIEHGWHDEELSDRHCLMLIVTEISEAVEADRKNRHADRKAFDRDTMRALRDMHICGEAYNTYENGCFNSYIKDSVEDELADVVIRCLDFAGLRKFDLFQDMTVSSTEKHNIESMSFTEWAFDVTSTVTDDFLAVECVVPLVVYKIYAYSSIKGFDLGWHVREKMKYNEKRPYKHGKAY